jgi:hypothetical protein
MAEVPASTDPLGKAADRIRETAKWLITIFTGVGGVLVAGSQLSDIGDLSVGRFVLALIAVLVGLCGIAYAINQAAKVMTASRVSLGELATSTQAGMRALRDRVNSDPSLLAGYDNVGQLSSEYAQALDKQKELYDLYYADVESDAKRLATDIADARVGAVDQAVQRMLSVASFERLSTAFDVARRHMFWGALVGAAGIVGFAAVAHWEGGGSEENLKIETPAEVTIKLTDQGRKLLAGRNGAKCTASTLTAIVVAIDGEKGDVVTLPSGGCRVARFKVPGRIGEFGN